MEVQSSHNYTHYINCKFIVVRIVIPIISGNVLVIPCYSHSFFFPSSVAELPVLTPFPPRHRLQRGCRPQWHAGREPTVPGPREGP